MPRSVIECTVNETQAGRLDQLICQLTGRSRADVRGLLFHQLARVNGKIRTSGGQRLEVGDVVVVEHDSAIRYSEPTPEREDPAFRMVFEDDVLLVVDKAPSVLTVPTDTGGRERTLLEAVDQYLKRKRQGRAAAVHRLDRGTSGLLVFGKSAEIARRLQEQFKVRKAEREYVAILAGELLPEKGTIETYLATSRRLQRYSVSRGEQGELAITHYEVTQRLRGATCVRVQLETGRRNQIRVHFAERGHPVLGDMRYRVDLSAHPQWRAKRLALHAATLGFDHPVTGEPVRFEAALPREFEKFVTAAPRGLSSGAKHPGSRPRRKK